MGWFAQKVRPHLVDDANEAHKFASNWAMGITLAAAASWEAMPHEWHDWVPDNWKAPAVGAMMVLGMVARVWKQ